jgi:hypothetical protein
MSDLRPLVTGALSDTAHYWIVSQGNDATSRSDGPLACHAERKLGRFAAILADAALPAACRPGGLRYSAVSQDKDATPGSDGPLACRDERKLGRFAAVLADAAVPAVRRPGGPRYWAESQTKSATSGSDGPLACRASASSAPSPPFWPTPHSWQCAGQCRGAKARNPVATGLRPVVPSANSTVIGRCPRATEQSHE